MIDPSYLTKGTRTRFRSRRVRKEPLARGAPACGRYQQNAAANPAIALTQYASDLMFASRVFEPRPIAIAGKRRTLRGAIRMVRKAKRRAAQ